jgi:hypothetical protein
VTSFLLFIADDRERTLEQTSVVSSASPTVQAIGLPPQSSQSVSSQRHENNHLESGSLQSISKMKLSTGASSQHDVAKWNQELVSNWLEAKGIEVQQNR